MSAASCESRRRAPPADAMKRLLQVIALAALVGGSAQAQVSNYQVVGDGIPQSLTGKPGDPARGRALLIKRDPANCLTCHSIKDKDSSRAAPRGRRSTASAPR